MPPRSPSASRFCSPSSLIHSVIRPTTGSLGLAELAAARAFQAGRVPRRLDAGHLHAEADAEEGHVAARGRSGREAILPSLPRSPKPPGTRMRVHRLEHRRRPRPRDARTIRRRASVMLTLTRLARPPWTSASVSDLIGVRQADIFADDADRHLALRVEQPVGDVVPAAPCRARARPSMPKASSTSASSPAA